MKKNYWPFLLLGISLNGQVGINTTNPNSTLSINGSIEADYKEITSDTYNVTVNNHYVTYNGNTNAVFTLPQVGIGNNSFSGRMYRFKNISPFNLTLKASDGNTLRSDVSSSSTLVISSGAYVELVNNNNTTGGTWDVSFSVFPKPTDYQPYVTQVPIPPTTSSGIPDWTNHMNTNYDSGIPSDTWWVLEKKTTQSSHTAAQHGASRVTVIYEYQGAPFDITKTYPILTTVASIPTIGSKNMNSLQGDYGVYSASVVSLQNDATSGKTRLTVTIALMSEVDPASDYWDDVSLNISLLKKMN